MRISQLGVSIRRVSVRLFLRRRARLVHLDTLVTVEMLKVLFIGGYFVQYPFLINKPPNALLLEAQSSPYKK